jgi:hypothetical protein
MVHYATLREYRFSPDVDDVRGSVVYGRDHEKLGKIDDIVVAHDTGETRYIVIDTDAGKRLLPPDRIFGAGDSDFQTRLSRADMASLPRFDDTSLTSAAEWEKHDSTYQSAYGKLREKYKDQWEEDPVQHRKGSTHVVTPEASEMPPSSTTTAGSITADVTPQRLAGKFPDAAPGASKLEMTPAGMISRDERAAHTAAPLSGRWQGFEESIRRDIDDIRRACTTCGKSGQRVA